MTFGEYAKELLMLVRLRQRLEQLRGSDRRRAERMLRRWTNRLRSEPEPWEHFYAFFRASSS